MTTASSSAFVLVDCWCLLQIAIYKCSGEIAFTFSHDNLITLLDLSTFVNQQFPQGASTPNAKGKIPLHYAAREGRTEMVSFLLHHCPHTATIKSKKDKLALHFAAGDGHIEVVRNLLQVHPQGASLTSAKGKLPLHFAARWGHVQIASDLLFVYPEAVRCVDWDGSLPLHDAAREGQLAMSKFLIERYSAGLSVANIRCEIPLFPAVRNGNVDLVVLFLQGWPAGGRHILKSVCADDNVQNWDWNIVELCLRGAVGNFTGCPEMEGKQPPAFCCPVPGKDSICSLGPWGHTQEDTRVVMEACCPRQARLHPPYPPAHLYYPQQQQQQYYNKYHHHQLEQQQQQQQLPPAAAAVSSSSRPIAMIPGASTTSASSLSNLKRPAAVRHSDRSSSGSSIFSDYDRPGIACCDSQALPQSSDCKMRSKSPMPTQGFGLCCSKKRAYFTGVAEADRKRSRLDSWVQEEDKDGLPMKAQPRKFNAVHAALVCGASSHVVRCALDTFPEQVSEADESGQLPIHLAAKHPRCRCDHRTTERTDPVVGQDDNKEDFINLVLNEIVKPFPGGACMEDSRGWLPLHLAIVARSDFRLIEALVEANPPSAVEPVLAIPVGEEKPRSKPPVYLATKYDCDLSTIYILLRLDPSKLGSSSSRLKPVASKNKVKAN